ncbi:MULTISPECIES: hypothetical protein [unclassified Streptomyces]|uniref:hypothetical protein n=1 Tax=unclassified Streptomyces TaxID=2593676 RepID=UPI000DBA0C8A|nr:MULTISPECIES: hypothetical protein [unclassified Streptomyces]MYT73408.1 hypothetical protein [Streptomyces sp. SID8367]
MLDHDDVLTLMSVRVPETRPLAGEMYGLGPGEAVPTSGTGLDMYEFLLEILTRGVMQPALEQPEMNQGLLRRCFDFVEELYDGADAYRAGNVYFTVLECLLDELRYLENAIPYLHGASRARVSAMLRTYAVEGHKRGLPPPRTARRHAS